MIRRHWRKLVDFILAAVLAALVMTQLGSQCIPPSGPPVPLPDSGFSAGSWGGPDSQWHQNAPYSGFGFGILAASTGDLESDRSVSTSMCNGIADSHFGPGSTWLLGHGRYVHAFWFLTSYTFAQNKCLLDLTGYGEAYGWGVVNASRFISAIGNTCPLPGGFADVEVVNSNDPAMWGAATESNQVNNNLVIQGFEDYVAQHAVCKFLLGVYSNTSSWESITGSASPSDVDASWFWLSHFGATLPALSSDKTEIENTFQMDVFSWQYATDACEDGIFFIQALLRAADASVGRIDKWTSTDPSIVC